MAILVSNRSPGERILLKTTPVLVGRGVVHPSDVLIDPTDTLASRRHAMLFYDFDQVCWFFEDTSRNGSFVNDQHVHHARVRLNSGDRLRIGKSFDVTFMTIGDTDEVVGNLLTSDMLSSAMQPRTDLFTNKAEQAPPKGLWLGRNGIVWRDGRRLPFSLSKTEYQLLQYLFEHANELCTYDEVIQAVWGEMRPRDTLHELIFRLRRKIEPHPGMARYLRIQPGRGIILLTQADD